MVILTVSKIVKVGNLSLAMVILTVSKIVKVGNLSLPGVILSLGPAVHSLDLLDPVGVLLVKLALNATEIGNPLVVVLGRPLLETFNLILSQIILPCCRAFKVVVVRSKSVVVGIDQSLDCVLELLIEVVASLKGGVEVVVH